MFLWQDYPALHPVQEWDQLREPDQACAARTDTGGADTRYQEHGQPGRQCGGGCNPADCLMCWYNLGNYRAPELGLGT